eukprot:CAMPEP_0197846274 /NCGR_PEP_ID=MMETSP1438-20131217/3040_1 /TAXON_ID=1461541 /ORGANISM="Pterosperma sp., Strain CCMP1384" /LENGTH=290 /DNA_ID=CAMNT_0043457855 /DNA_START=9 /DNA_END=881 /DNA_ORIENTATION=-
MPHFSVERGRTGMASLKVSLKKGEKIKAESDALVVKSEHIEVGSNMDGGILGGLARNFLTGESFFFQTLTATQGDDNNALLAPNDVGDICLADLGRDGALLMQRGAYLAADDSLEITSTMQSGVMKSAFSGTGLFVLKAQGTGTLAFSAYGSIIEYNLKPQEKISVDNGHLVAWSSSIQFQMGMASQSLYTSVTSGEGMMCHFTGPGTVYVQTHKPPVVITSQDGKKKASTQDGGIVGMCLGFLFLMVFVAFFAFFVYMAINHPDSIEWSDGSGGSHRSHRHQRSIGGRF